MRAHLTTTTVPNLLPMANRSPGIHISDIIRRLKHYDTSPPSMVAQGRMLLGKALEWAILDMFKLHHRRGFDASNYYEPGELQLDDIYGTLDIGRWWFDDSRRQVTEIKLTFAKPPPEPSDPTDDPTIDSPALQAYIWQLKSYCRMAGTLRGRLIVCYVGGFADVHWRDWEITFDQLELELHWAMMVSVADQLRSTDNELSA